MSRTLEIRLQRLERFAARPTVAPELAALARQKLVDMLGKIGPHVALQRLEERATSPRAIRLRDSLRRVLEVSHANP
ncbi:MAG: hypothetical protein AB7S67_12305 [Thiomonas sp.]